MSDDLIKKEEAKEAVCKGCLKDWGLCHHSWDCPMLMNLEMLPSADAAPKETPKRVLWAGWKGHRDTRYKCPNCRKPVKNDDVYCHRCGQKLMFPHIDFTPYVKGQKKEVIVRWDDEVY